MKLAEAKAAASDAARASLNKQKANDLACVSDFLPSQKSLGESRAGRKFVFRVFWGVLRLHSCLNQVDCFQMMVPSKLQCVKNSQDPNRFDAAQARAEGADGRKGGHDGGRSGDDGWHRASNQHKNGPPRRGSRTEVEALGAMASRFGVPKP